MRKLAARSIAVALLAVFIPGCTSGGQKSFSWSKLNPVTYFSKSDSDSPVPKPSDQMGPSVTMGEESSLASRGTSGGMAPPSPYSATQAVAGLTQSWNSSTSSTTPQRGMYDTNGYSDSSLPLSPSSSAYDQYSSSGYNLPASGVGDYQAPSGGYSATQNGSGYDMNPTAQYAVGGSYDIQNRSPVGSMGPPVYASPTAPYANNATPYQVPPLPPQGNGSGLVQDPYGNMNSSSYSGATSSYPALPESSYADSTYGNSGDTQVASLPKLPPLPNQYTSSQPAYDPGNTGYNPPNVPAYTPPLPGGYVQPATATEPNYSPGSVSRYPSASSQSAPTAGATSGGYGTTGYY